MSSFLAELRIDDETINVLKCTFEFNIRTDESGFTSQRALPGNIHITLESTKKIDFVTWMRSNETKEGEINFYKRDMMASAKRLIFSQAYCIHYSEIFVSEGKFPMTTIITISAYEVSVDDSSIIRNWPLD